MQDVAGHPFVFTATGKAYFRIWIVNLLLSIVTIGFYSPWAKVRRLRYFYGNTLVDGSPFEFHGRPFALLKGRLIGLVLLGAYTQAAKFSLVLWLAVVALLILLFPWLLWKSLRFRLANSSWRGLRFGFDGTIGGAYATFVPLMLMVVAPTLTLAVAQGTLDMANPPTTLPVSYSIAIFFVLVLAPWFYFRLRAYQHRNARLGTTPFAFDGRARAAYWIAFKLFLLGIGFLVVGAIVGSLVGFPLYFALRHLDRAGAMIGGVAGIAVGYLFILSGGSQSIALVQNYVWNHSALGAGRFTSRVGLAHLWWLVFSNLLLTLVTLGFFWPFAVVRSMRYRIGCVSWDGDSSALIARAGEDRSGATGEETADLFGLDLAL